jgi:hypothetical protein
VPAGLTFVYRSHYDGPLSKRVVHLPHASLLEWFREGWVAADPRAFVRESLRGSVYGLASAFERAQELGAAGSHHPRRSWPTSTSTSTWRARSCTTSIRCA